MYAKALSVLALVGAAQAHMSLFYPPPLGGDTSINPQSKKVDPEFNFPLGCCDNEGLPSEPSPGICRGHLDRFDIEDASVTWKAGQDAYFQLTDFTYSSDAPGGTHSGGSCQVGFSVDKGKTWKVAASYHGACPHRTEDGSPEAQTFDFKVPTGMPNGDALFSWVWLNREHESFMGCSKVRITGGSGEKSTPAESSQPKQTPQQPAGNEEPTPPATSTRAGGGRRPTTTTTVATTIYRPESTDVPAPENEEYDEEDGAEDTEDNEDNEWWSKRAHRKVRDGARRYQVDGDKCDCHRDELTMAARCSCDVPESKREEIERKALRMHRRTFYKRVDACEWATAPPMQVSYYTVDAKCAADAKSRMPESDEFELKWDNVHCGVVEGDGDMPLKTMRCDMYDA